MARQIGLRRGAYLLAALGSLPWNTVATLVAPHLDRLSARNPFCIAVRAIRR